MKSKRAALQRENNSEYQSAIQRVEELGQKIRQHQANLLAKFGIIYKVKT